MIVGIYYVCDSEKSSRKYEMAFLCVLLLCFMTATSLLFLFKIFTYWLRWDIVAAILCKGRGILSDLFIWIFGYTGSHCCAAFSLVAASRGYSSCRAQASSCGGFSCWGAQALRTRASAAVACAWLLLSMWNLPGPGIEPMYPALAGAFLTTGPPVKSRLLL